MFEDKYKPFVIRDSSGQNWYVRIYHDEGIRCLYTSKTDEEGPTMVKIKSLDGYHKIKIGTNGQLFTYPLDSIG